MPAKSNDFADNDMSTKKQAMVAKRGMGQRLDLNNSMFSKWYFIEVLLLLICPIPHFEFYVITDYSVKGADPKHPDYITIHQFFSDYLLVLMFFRLYFVFKCFFNWSSYADSFSKRMCKHHGFYPGFRFVVKSQFKSNPGRTVFVLFTLTVVCLAYILRIFELRFAFHPKSNTIKEIDGDYFNHLYLIVITMTTVGYGDFLPHTIPGQIVIMFTALWGAFMISLIVLLVTNIFDLSEEQHRAFQQIKISRSAAKAISKSFKFFIQKKRYYMHLKQNNPDLKSDFLDGLQKTRQTYMIRSLRFNRQSNPNND